MLFTSGGQPKFYMRYFIFYIFKNPIVIKIFLNLKHKKSGFYIDYLNTNCINLDAERLYDHIKRETFQTHFSFSDRH